VTRSCFRAKWILGFVLLVSFAALLAADETTDRVDKVFAVWDTTTTPGAALAVIKDGQIIYERGYGMAKIEDGLVMTPQKIFDIGSTSKQFTAACLAILIRQGKVGLDDDVRKYFPEMRLYGKPVFVRNLVYHTSGLRDYNGLLGLAGFRPESDCPNVDEALEVIFKQKKLNYPSGEEFAYTNTGYFLMGQIVERVSGKSLNAFAQENIFKPLGMTHTLYQDDHSQIIRNRATGYDPSANGYKINMSNWDETGDGNVYTSVEDLYLWDQAFYNYKLGRELMDLLHTTGTLNSGKKLDYAFGLFLGEHKGLKTVSHGGAWALSASLNKNSRSSA
jgi:CubicO group peptidase (beta-lactamase class C family)